MPFSIRDFFDDASRTLSTYVDFRTACANSIAALNEDPTSRMAETDFYSKLSAIEGLPPNIASGFRSSWEPRFKEFREQHNYTNMPMTPSLKLFKICAQSVATRHNHALDRVLAKEWMALAVSPEEREGLDALTARMTALHMDEEWTGGLVSTWEYLFGAGGHGDRNIKPPSVYYEVFDRQRSHVELRTPSDEDLNVYGVREYRKDELDAALSLIEKNRLTLVLGHPGWRPVARSFDLWLETLKMKLSGSEVELLDIASVNKPEEKLAAALSAIAKAKSRKLVLLAETGHSPHAAAAGKIARLIADAGVTEMLPVLAIDHKALNQRQAAQIVFGEKALQNGDEARTIKFIDTISSVWAMLPADISYLADELDNMASRPDLETLGIKLAIAGRDISKNYHKQAPDSPLTLSMPNGSWGRYLDRMFALSKANVITIGPCPAPFFTMNLNLRA